jgi:membrane protease YdiL (CAAX protease family)
MTAPHLLMSEAKSVWLVFSLPMEVSAYFERRARAWRVMAVVVAAATLLGMAIWRGGVDAEGAWRAAAALVGVWVISLVIYAIMIGDARVPDTDRGETAKPQVWRTYGCMVAASLLGSAIYLAPPWTVVSSLIVWWMFGIALWQGVERRLRHILEPTERIPHHLTLADALRAVLIFFIFQSITAALLIALKAPETALLISFLIGGVVALTDATLRLRHRRLRLPSTPARDSSSPLRDLLVATATCIVAAWCWLQLIDWIPALRTLLHSAGGSAEFDITSLPMILLLVIAAPVIEELLFRRHIFRIMQAFWSPRTALITSALLFAIVHPGISFPPVFLLGLATAWLYSRTGRIALPMLLHAAYNAAVIVFHSGN